MATHPAPRPIVQFPPHPDEFRPVVPHFLAIAGAPPETADPLEEFRSDTGEPALTTTDRDLAAAQEKSFPGATIELATELLPEQHEHRAPPPDWRERNCDDGKPALPNHPFRCVRGLDHDQKRCPGVSRVPQTPTA